AGCRADAPRLHRSGRSIARAPGRLIRRRRRGGRGGEDPRAAGRRSGARSDPERAGARERRSRRSRPRAGRVGDDALAPDEAARGPPGLARQPSAPAPRPARGHGPLTDDEMWALAVEGAAPLADRSARVKPNPEPISVVTEPLDPELAAYDELRALVAGAAPFDIADTDEFIEGAARGLDRH